jgi:hypothetical protein
MEQHAGIDVSLEWSSVCIFDGSAADKSSGEQIVKSQRAIIEEVVRREYDKLR